MPHGERPRDRDRGASPALRYYLMTTLIVGLVLSELRRSGEDGVQLVHALHLEPDLPCHLAVRHRDGGEALRALVDPGGAVDAEPVAFTWTVALPPRYSMAVRDGVIGGAGGTAVAWPQRW